MKFNIRGHPKVLGTHKTTIEFTKDKDLSLKGDCIVGVDADFKVTKEIIDSKKIRIRLVFEGIEDDFTAVVNKAFEDNHEMVFRKTDFLSKRTLGVHADKAAIDLSRDLIEKLKDKNSIGEVIIERIE